MTGGHSIQYYVAKNKLAKITKLHSYKRQFKQQQLIPHVGLPDKIKSVKSIQPA